MQGRTIDDLALKEQVSEYFGKCKRQDPRHEDHLTGIETDIYDVIDSVPDCTNSERKGTWYLDREKDGYLLKCSACGKAAAPRFRYKLGQPFYLLPDFCPECGADMRNSNENEDA